MDGCPSRPVIAVELRRSSPLHPGQQRQGSASGTALKKRATALNDRKSES